MHPVYARNNLQVYVVAVCVLKIEKKLISNAAMTDFIKLFIKFSYMREPTSHLAMLKVLRYSSTVNFPIVYNPKGFTKTWTHSRFEIFLKNFHLVKPWEKSL